MDLFAHDVPIKLVLYAHKNGNIFVRDKLGGDYREPYQEFFRGKSFYIPHMLSIHNLLAHMFFNGIGKQINLHELVDMRFADQEYGINILKIQEIIPVKPIDSLPNTESYFKGVMMYCPPNMTFDIFFFGANINNTCSGMPRQRDPLIGTAEYVCAVHHNRIIGNKEQNFRFFLS